MARAGADGPAGAAINSSLLEIPAEAAAIAERFGVVKDVHSEDYIFQFVEKRFNFGRAEALIHYYGAGQNSAKLIKGIVESFSTVKKFLGKPWEPQLLLDFASGYGCVARHIPASFPNSTVEVCDIHPQAVAFNKIVLGLDGVVSSPEPENVALPVGRYDVVFVLSLFSHLPRRTFKRWLASILSAVRPGGIIIFTTHGRISHEGSLKWVPVDPDGFGFVAQSEQKDLSTDDYGVAVSYPFHVLDIVRSLPDAALFRFQEGFWWGHQDVYVLERTETARPGAGPDRPAKPDPATDARRPDPSPAAGHRTGPETSNKEPAMPTAIAERPPTETATAFVNLVYKHILRRAPGEVELNIWTQHMLKGMTERDLIERFVASPEYTKRFAGFFPAHPPGHYYSPVVDPRELVGSRAPNRAIEPTEIPGITLDVPAMRRWWQSNAKTLRSTPFPEEADPRWRYYANNGIFPIGDAAVLRAMIVESRPARIIEIGSGFSTAAMLDTIDEHGLSTKITCIEPYADRLKSRLRPEDRQRISIIEKPVQEVPLDEFRSLVAGDILFIDSTHVLKTGSDVNYELFSILPILPAGVVIHFHDMQYPFEYPDHWIFELQYSWNEIYAVRAFLMYNSLFKVTLMNSLMHSRGSDLISEIFPRLNSNPGGSLWIRKVAKD